MALSLFALLVWMALVATAATLDSSDPAGNAMAQGFAGLEAILLWLLLGVLLLVGAIKGAMPAVAFLPAIVLLPVSAVAAMTALGLLADPATPPFLWPIVVPALIPPLLVAFCLLALMPRIPAAVASGFTWGLTAVLCLALLPMTEWRNRSLEHQAELRATWASDFALMAPDAPLWEWTPFLQTRDETRRDAVLERIRHLDRRQADTATMLERGDFPLHYLGAFDLQPVQAICDKARALLLRRVQPLVPRSPGSRPYADIADEVESAVAAMDWLVGHGCACDAESRAWEAMASAYRNPNYDVYRLKELREPRPQ
jgi:hypothetical protein